MKKENIFDLYAAQHKDEPEPEADRVPGEVKPEDVEKPREVPAQDPPQDPEPKQEHKPDNPQDPEPKQEGGSANAI